MDAHQSVQVDALMVLEHHHFVSETVMSEESSCWVLTKDAMHACKPVMTLESPSLFFQRSRPSSGLDWTSLECIIALEQWGFHVQKLVPRTPCSCSES